MKTIKHWLIVKAITTDFLANKKPYSCWDFGFVGFKNGFNHRQIN